MTYKAGVLLVLSLMPCIAEEPARFWPAGRYDGDRIIVYFQAVRFGNNFPLNAAKLSPPVASGFFDASALTAKDIEPFLQKAGAEHFAVGDQYDLLLGGSESTSVTLTQLVGCPGDEGVGNDSYIGALAKVIRPDGLIFEKDYYVVAKHRDSSSGGPYSPHAALQDTPVRLDIVNQIASKLAARKSGVPILQVQAFTVADGTLRYYARAQWPADNFALAAWLTPVPTLHILALERQTTTYGFDDETPKLLNVVDLGVGRTGMVVGSLGEDSTALFLLQYRDGETLATMRKRFVISAAE